MVGAAHSFPTGAEIRPWRMRLSSSIIIVLALASLHSAPASAQSSTPQLSPNAPEDRPVSATAVCQWQAMVKAMEPYVAQARQSYPDARRRFVGRAQPVRPFFVTTQLHDAKGHHEQVFVAVDSIVGAPGSSAHSRARSTSCRDTDIDSRTASTTVSFWTGRSRTPTVARKATSLASSSRRIRRRGSAGTRNRQGEMTEGATCNT